MKLLRLKAEQLRQFRGPVEIDNLQPGINLFTGPNESGKSTLVHAIRAAFFERHRSSSVADLQPWGDSSATPTVELDFAWQEQTWKLTKSFLNKKRCDLSVEGTTFSGDEADDKLADLLGFELPKRGASRPDQWGIPGLLWIEQGAGQDIQAPAAHAGQHLKAALGGNLGEVTSSTGDELIHQVAAERGKLLTPTGKPTGDYRTAAESVDGLQAQFEALQGDIQQYRQQVDRLGQLKEQQARADSERLWEAFREQANQAEARLREVDAWQQEQDRDRQAQEGYQASIDTTLELLSGFQNQQRDLEQRQHDKEEAEQKLARLEEGKPATQAALEQAKQAHTAARQALKQAQQHQQRKQQMRELDSIDAALKDIQGKLKRAEERHAALLENRRKQQALHIDPQAIKRLESVVASLDRLAIQQDVEATRLQFDLIDGKSVTLNGESLAGQSEHLLIEPGDVAIDGVGSLRVLPGGKDVAKIARAKQNLTDEQGKLLSQLGVVSLDDANKRLEQQQELEQRIRQDQTVLEELAPAGLADLSDRLQLKQAQKETLESRIPTLPDDSDTPDAEDDNLSTARAEVQLESAEQALQTAQAAAQEQQNNLLLAAQNRDRARQEWQRLDRELQTPDRKDREKQADAQLAELRSNERRLKETLQQRQKQIQDANPESIRQDAARFTRSAEAEEKADAERQRELLQIQTRLEAAGAEGLEEQRAELTVKRDEARRRLHELERRAKALDHLHSTLTEHRLALTRQLQAPLQKHLNHYLRLLFPDAFLNVDENLIPNRLVRHHHDGEERGLFGELSFGAREQMALISRLAYADLLQDAEKPTLLILDDALVHSDPERLKAMKRVLYDAAQRHQILLFTCHADNWRDLGVAARDVEGLRSG